MKRAAYMISDGTGITVDSLSNSLMTQFEHIEFEKKTIPYVDTLEKAEQLLQEINATTERTHIPPLVFITLVNPEISACIKKANACVLDLFNTFVGPMEQALETKSSYTVGKTHGMANILSYDERIEAINYTLAHDDGLKTIDYDQADIILIGVSRCGKTPSCLYMALQFGIFAANYPLTDEDLIRTSLPTSLKPYQQKLFGLTIDPERLQHIRSERRPNSQYASIMQCKQEIKHIETLFQQESIPFLNSTRFSIEEIVTKVMNIAKIKRKI